MISEYCIYIIFYFKLFKVTLVKIQKESIVECENEYFKIYIEM